MVTVVPEPELDSSDKYQYQSAVNINLPKLTRRPERLEGRGTALAEASGPALADILALRLDDVVLERDVLNVQDDRLDRLTVPHLADVVENVDDVADPIKDWKNELGTKLELRPSGWGQVGRCQMTSSYNRQRRCETPTRNNHQ